MSSADKAFKEIEMDNRKLQGEKEGDSDLKGGSFTYTHFGVRLKQATAQQSNHFVFSLYSVITSTGLHPLQRLYSQYINIQSTT